MARNRRRRRHGGRHEMGAALEALAALEIAVRGRGAALVGRERSAFIARHMEQPGSRQSKPAALKILSSPSASACIFTMPEPGTIMALTLAATRLPSTTLRHFAQVLDAAIGARADEDAVERDVGDLRAGRETHIFQRPPLRAALVLVRDLVRIRHDAGDRDDVLGARAPGDDGRQIGARRGGSRCRRSAPSSVRSVSQ